MTQDISKHWHRLRMRKINPIDQNCVECEDGKMKIQNDNTTGSFKGGKDSGEIQVAIWQLGHQHRWNLVPGQLYALHYLICHLFWLHYTK